MAVGEFTTLTPILRGDYETLPLELRNADGSPRDVTNETVTFTAKLKIDDDEPFIQKTKGAGIVFTDETTGIGYIEILGTDTDSLVKNVSLYCDVEVKDTQDRASTDLYKLPVKRDVNG
jgi:hypothetical protein